MPEAVHEKHVFWQPFWQLFWHVFMHRFLHVFMNMFTYIQLSKEIIFPKIKIQKNMLFQKTFFHSKFMLFLVWADYCQCSCWPGTQNQKKIDAFLIPLLTEALLS